MMWFRVADGSVPSMWLSASCGRPLSAGLVVDGRPAGRVAAGSGDRPGRPRGGRPAGLMTWCGPGASTGSPKSQVIRMAAEPDGKVAQFRQQPLDARLNSSRKDDATGKAEV